MNGKRVATKEKAFLDVLYYYYKGKTFSFNPDTDVNIEDVDMTVIDSCLKKYDKQFVSFFNKFIGEQQ